MTMMAERAVGQRAQSDSLSVSAEEILRFAEATGDENPCFMDGAHPGFAAPPVFTARYFNPLYLRILGLAGANFARVVFGEMDIRYHRPMVVGPEFNVAVETTALEEKSSGQLLRAHGTVTDQSGERLVESVASFFVRGAKGKGSGVAPTRAASPQTPVEAFSIEMATRREQPALFAKIANDPNPIHLDERVARAAGFDGVIMHGLCSMALCGRAIIGELCGGDPSGLSRLAVRFSKPALPGKSLTVRAFEPEAGAGKVYGFVAVDAIGDAVITSGVAEIR